LWKLKVTPLALPQEKNERILEFFDREEQKLLKDFGQKMSAAYMEI
jgi:hypothetical protein